MKPKISFNLLELFFLKYFSLERYRYRMRPTQEQILHFLHSNNVIMNETNKNILALFVWDFWDINIIILGKSKDKIKRFHNKHYK